MTTPPTAVTPLGTLASVSLDCPDPGALADFYAALLGLTRFYETPDGSLVSLAGAGVAVTFMRAEDHVAPRWPKAGPAGQLQQMHLDISVTDLDAAVSGALVLGARAAEHQPAPTVWRVLIDPAGHPFCLTTAGA